VGDGGCAEAAASAMPPGALAVIACHPSASVVAALHYAVYPTAQDARTRYDAVVESSAVEPGSGDCFAGQAGETGFLTGGQPAGRVLCFIDQSGGGSLTRVVWVDERLAIIGEARGASGVLLDLFNWWKSQSGPV
jgi:hypothetical protein